MTDMTIQLEVDMMKRDTQQQKSSVNKNHNGDNRKKAIIPNKRPSRARGTDAVSGKCKVCSSNSWDTDAARGETICAECGYVAAENMIDPRLSNVFSRVTAIISAGLSVQFIVDGLMVLGVIKVPIL